MTAPQIQMEPKHVGLVSALVIDDSMLARRRLIRTAQETNLEWFIKEASDVQRFGARLDQDKFDVIFVDLNLGADNGLTLLPIVRRHPVNKDAALIMIAGDSHADAALAALREGFADYIEKDALSAASLERATINALQKLRLSRAAVSAREDTQSVEKLLSSFAEACNQEMRPLMARMVRQVRQVKSVAAAHGAGQSILEIETTCARIDAFFQDISALVKEGKLTEFMEESLLSSAAGTVPSRPAEPVRVAPPEVSPRSAPKPRRPKLFS